MSVTWQKLVFIGLFQLNALLATGQDPLANSIAMGTGNVAEMKRQAEAGKPEAQVKLGDLLSFNQRKTDALEWYRKAAYNGSTDAPFWGSGELQGAEHSAQSRGRSFMDFSGGNEFSSWCLLEYVQSLPTRHRRWN
jgi:hypothetical protein